MLMTDINSYHALLELEWKLKNIIPEIILSAEMTSTSFFRMTRAHNIKKGFYW